jgi:hypothetical protein
MMVVYFGMIRKWHKVLRRWMIWRGCSDKEWCSGV